MEEQINDNMITKYLSSGESVMWNGKPDNKIRVSAIDLPALISGVFMIVIGAVISAIALKNNQGSSKYVFSAFAALIAVIGIVRIVNLFLKKAKRIKNDVYVITTKRILILTKGADGKLTKKRFVTLENAAEGNIIVGKDGVGSIAFWEETNNARMRDNDLAFYDIEDCERVHGIFVKAKRNIQRDDNYS